MAKKFHHEIMNPSFDMVNDGKNWTLDALSRSIRQLHEYFAIGAKRAINVSLTLRNWLIGFYIAEYQLHGADRAKYGDKVVATLACQLKGISNCSRQELYKYIAFYKAYPKIVGTVYRQLPRNMAELLPQTIVGTVSAQSEAPNEADAKHGEQWEVITHLSYNHLLHLLQIEDDTARRFYETECIRGCWSVRELKRQIGSMLFERTALSKNKRRLIEETNADAERDTTLALTIRDPYVFDFLGLQAKEIVSEKTLEEALIGKLQSFLLELGRGFCFEARQKRLLIGDEYFQVDLVFYHRILKCHVLIDLKNEPFTHENIGQLNSYVAYYAKHEMTPGDNPPIGILLCTQKNNELVEYALAGMNQNLFVSKYQLNLPSKRDMEDFIRRNRLELEREDRS